jgi:hypothetical protein
MLNVKGCRRKRSWNTLKYHPAICLDGLRKKTKYLSQDSRPSGRDLKPGPPKCEAGMLTTQTLHSVIWSSSVSLCLITY